MATRAVTAAAAKAPITAHFAQRAPSALASAIASFAATLLGGQRERRVDELAVA